MARKPAIVLTGGLGNQLFQLACGLAKHGPVDFVLESTLAKPRLNSRGRPELHAMVFPCELEFTSRTNSGCISRRVGSLAFKLASKRFLSGPVQAFWIWLKNQSGNLGIFLSDGVGFDSRVFADQKYRWVFGPFQTFKYPQIPPVKEFMSAMSPRNYPTWLKELALAAQDEKPIILHIRLSDYKGIPELGILTQTYFFEALQRARRHFPGSRIWLFTDEEKLALQILGTNASTGIRIINYDRSDASANLEAMRLGHCFVLSNSTFSWWGAFLSHTPNPVVYCPQRWFKTRENPLFLIPDAWIKVPNT
jgi:hypothetical protein